MERDDLRKSELEQDLEALYKEVASAGSLENIQTQETWSKEPTKTEEGSALQNQSEESLSQEKEKRTFRLFRIIPGLGLIALSCIIVAILIWPKIYLYESIDSGGKNYLLRINSLTGGAMYFDGREWRQSPLPADVAGKVSESPENQPTRVQPAGRDKMKDRTEGVSIRPPSKNTKNWKYAIQIKAYPEAGNSEAIAFVEHLKKGQPDVHMEKVHLPGRGIWYRILLGYFTSAEEASNYMKEKKISDVYPGSHVRPRSE